MLYTYTYSHFRSTAVRSYEENVWAYLRSCICFMCSFACPRWSWSDTRGKQSHKQVQGDARDGWHGDSWGKQGDNHGQWDASSSWNHDRNAGSSAADNYWLWSARDRVMQSPVAEHEDSFSEPVSEPLPGSVSETVSETSESTSTFSFHLAPLPLQNIATTRTEEATVEHVPSGEVPTTDANRAPPEVGIGLTDDQRARIEANRRRALARRARVEAIRVDTAPLPDRQPDVELAGAAAEAIKCVICQDNLGEDASVVTALPCSHVFHTHCINNWAHSKNLPLEMCCPHKCHRSVVMLGDEGARGETDDQEMAQDIDGDIQDELAALARHMY